jgi:hypothetical protein
MSKTKNISPRNYKGQRHGYCELYDDNSILWFKCFFHNGKKVGYEGNYYSYLGELTRKKYNL